MSIIVALLPLILKFISYYEVMAFYLKLVIFILPATVYSLNLSERIEGLTIGTLYGDALGGPIEFQALKKKNMFLQKYSKPKSPYAAWRDYAPAGTITDDSRHKIIFFNSLIRFNKLTRLNLAKSYELFPFQSQQKKLALTWLKEYSQAARWIMNPKSPNSKPPQLLFNGQRNASGLLALLPLATLYPDNPDKVYLKCIEINFLDSGAALDLNCSLISAVAVLLTENSTMKNFVKALRTIDPLQLSKTDFVRRDQDVLLDFIEDLVSRNYSHYKFKKKLIAFTKPKYGWEDNVVFSVVISYLLRNKNNYQQAIYDIIEFGQDTDTYLQLACAIIGSIKGPDFFPKREVQKVQDLLWLDYGVKLDSWYTMINKYSTQ